MVSRMSRQLKGIFFDDIGSFPLPKGVRLESLSPDQYLQLVRDVLDQKLRAGVEVPTYPQFRDMIRMFLDPIENPDLSESPYLIKREHAKIMELQAVPPGRVLARLCHRTHRALYIRLWGHALPRYSLHYGGERGQVPRRG